MKKVLGLIACFAVVAMLNGCKEQTTADKMQDAVKDAAKTTEKAANDAAKAVDKAATDASKAVEKAVE